MSALNAENTLTHRTNTGAPFAGNGATTKAAGAPNSRISISRTLALSGQQSRRKRVDMVTNDTAPLLVRSDALLGFLFDGAAYVGIHKNAAGRITLVVNHGDGSMRTSCSKKGLSYADKLIECRNRLSETPNTQAEGRGTRTLPRFVGLSSDV